MLGLPCRLARLIVARPQDQSKNPEIVTVTSMVYWMGALTHLKQKVLEQPPHSVQQAGHGSNLHYLGEKEATR